ncbi:MAG: hypothetical protein LC798_01305 [Chloroflexi bacterium]|nr:hypothetical protein [Chloroflexota bacterium]
MLQPAMLLALLLAAPMPAGDAEPDLPAAIAAVPDEPGATVLPDAAILQTVVADVDADGIREVVRLVRGDGDAVLAEVWESNEGIWQLRGAPVEVVPPSRVGLRLDPVYQATPVRLLVREVEGVERVTVASQPHFEEIDIGPPCCLILHDLAMEEGTLVRRSVSAPANFASAVIVIDFDGDGTDEVLSTESLSPAGDISYPIKARVHRWSGSSFDEPTETHLPVGSGDSPFVLGDSDGLPGEEAAIISTLGPPGMFRMRLVDGDGVELDRAGFTAEQAVAVPLGDDRGVAVVGPVIGLMAAPWPPGETVAAPVSESGLGEGRIIGAVAVDGVACLVVQRPGTEIAHVLRLPELKQRDEIRVSPSPAAAAFAGRAAAPFSGTLPGGGIDGAVAVIHHGYLIPSGDPDVTGPDPVASLAGATPVGLVGGGLDHLVLQHGPTGRPAPDADGGPMVVPTLQDAGWTSIAPLELTRRPEAGDAALDPPLDDIVRLDAPDGLGVGPEGFAAEVTAPPGSRVVVAGPDPSTIRAPVVVPASGRVTASFEPPSFADGSAAPQATLIVLTPAGRGYLASWDVRLLAEPPPLALTVETPFGSSAVEVRGRTASHAMVRVAGSPVEVGASGRFAATIVMPPWPTDVEVEVSDALGNVGARTVSGIGLLDYRQLPWVPITAALVALVGVVLFLRVPRSSVMPRRPDDDATLEELEPD